MGADAEGDAIALFQAGRFAEAETAFHAILGRNPRNANALHALGVIAMQAGRLDEAVEWLRRALQAEPGAFAILYNLGTALRRTGQAIEALPAFRRAVALNSRSADAHLGLGNTLRDLGDRPRARESFAAALRIDPALGAAHYNLALVEIEEGDDAAAEASLGRAVALEPGNAEAWNHLGLIAHRRERIDDAIALYGRALEARGDFAPALANWGNALKDRGDLGAAMERYERAVAADPRETLAWVNLASVALERGNLALAREAATRALEIKPLLADARYALGLVQLREHDFTRGWEGYERRFETTPPVARIAAPRGRPLQADELVRVKRLAVRREQGLGDQVLFSTLLPELVERGTACVAELDPRLRSAYRRSLPALEFPESSTAAAALAGCDREVAMGSLPALFRGTLASFDRQPTALLRADAERVARTRSALGPGRNVAIAWRSFQGFGRRHIGERKSIPLERFGALEGLGVRLIDLQYGDVDDERRAFDERHGRLRVEIAGLDPRDDIEGVLAAIEASDLVITASNATAHFAGALGKRAWLVYLGATPPFHYWTPRPDARSLWYPSVEIVTDARWTTWETAFAAIAARLARE